MKCYFDINISTSNKYEIHTWFERDRAHVELREKETQNTIVEWWDEKVQEAIDDGFLNPKDFKSSAIEYAIQHGFIKQEIMT